MSLYRKYRPHTFQDVIGQEHVVTTLQNTVAQGQLAHAYLFAGSRGTGKTSVARILAKAMLTQGMEEGALKKQITHAVEDGSLVDLVEIDAASNRGIDDIRMLVEKIQFSPVVATAKVYIIDEVHMLTREAFNALLKTLEEPPSYAFFILATTELQKIPATIQSRCQRFTFQQLKQDDIILGLTRVADKEGITVAPEAMQAIARYAQGGMRDALSLLDQLRSLPSINVTDVQERIGETGQQHVEEILSAIERGDKECILLVVATLEKSGIALDVFARQLLTSVRSKLHHSIKNKENIEHYARYLDALLQALRDIRISPIPGLALETALLGLCETHPKIPSATVTLSASIPEHAPSTPAVVHKKDATTPVLKAAVSKLTESVTSPSSSPAQAPHPAPQDARSHVSQPPSTSAGVSLLSLRSVWLDIVNSVSPASVKMSLKNAHVHAVQGNTVVLSFVSGFHREKVAATDASIAVENAIQKMTGISLKIDCTLAEEQHSKVPANTEMVNVAEAASEVF